MDLFLKRVGDGWWATVNHVVVIQKVISLIQKIMVIPVNMTYNDDDDDDDDDGDDEAWSLKLEASKLDLFKMPFFCYCQSNLKSFDIIKL